MFGGYYDDCPSTGSDMVYLSLVLGNQPSDNLQVGDYYSRSPQWHYNYPGYDIINYDRYRVPLSKEQGNRLRW
jgi:hypothetical protein